MRRTSLRLLIILGMLALSLAACAHATPVPVAEEQVQSILHITVSVVPQQYLVERIGGNRVTVQVMVLPGQSPATYEPKPEQLRALSQADAYLSIRVPFEDAWLSKIVAVNPEMLLVDTTQGIERVVLDVPHEHEGEPVEADPDQTELDPHIWTSPRLVKIQARTVADALIKLDPAGTDHYEANLTSLLADIEILDTEIRASLANLTNKKFIVFHPSWGYFAQEYGLEQIAIEVGGQEPSAQELAAIIEEARHENIRVVFAQPEFSTRSAETIAREIGGQVLLISPLELDWLGNMRKVAATFARVLE